jgi:hypothetical protein
VNTDYGCGNCGADLPNDPQVRHVPRKGGRRLPVCEECRKAIDAQATLGQSDGSLLGARKEHAA